MRLHKTLKNAVADDEGVSPVIAVILMVAITVVLAATVYVWVSGFASDDTGPEQASATAKGVDLNDDGDVEWIKLSLTKGENAPYDASDVTVSGAANDGADIPAACQTAKATNSSGDMTCNDQFDSGDSWDVGETKWVPCDGVGNHALTVAVSGTTILDSTITCDVVAVP